VFFYLEPQNRNPYRTVHGLDRLDLNIPQHDRPARIQRMGILKRYPGREFFATRRDQENFPILNLCQILTTNHWRMTGSRNPVALPVMVRITVGDENMGDAAPLGLWNQAGEIE
jgi:hypothetical protein